MKKQQLTRARIDQIHKQSETAFQFTLRVDMFTARHILSFIRDEKRSLHEELKRAPPTLRRIHHYTNLWGLQFWLLLRYLEYEYIKRQPIISTREQLFQDWYNGNRTSQLETSLTLQYLGPGVTRFIDRTELSESWYDNWQALCKRKPRLRRRVRRFITDVQAFNNMSLDDLYDYNPNDLYQYLFHYERRAHAFEHAVQLNRAIRAGETLQIE